jgi:L-rhamnono-1,4-lactonase
VKQRARTDAVWKKVRGVRYLVQDKPPGTMLEQGFVDGLKWLGSKGFAFDLGVDARQGGLWQLREAVEMLGRVYGDAEVTFVISMLFFSVLLAVLLTSRPPLQTQSASL